jgi:hypothetical protein
MCGVRIEKQTAGRVCEGLLAVFITRELDKCFQYCGEFFRGLWQMLDTGYWIPD